MRVGYGGIVSLKSDIENQADVRNCWTSKVFQHGYQVQKLVIVSI